MINKTLEKRIERLEAIFREPEQFNDPLEGFDWDAYRAESEAHGAYHFENKIPWGTEGCGDCAQLGEWVASINETRGK